MLAQDETDLLLFPPLRVAWSKRGEVAKVWLSGRNARRVIFGAMNPRTGTRLFAPREKGRSGDFQAFLGEIRSHYRGWPVAMSCMRQGTTSVYSRPAGASGVGW